MRSLLTYLSAYKKESILAPLFKLIEALFELVVPLIVAALIDQGILRGNGSVVIRMGIWMIALSVLGMAFSITAQFFAAKAAVGFSTAARSALLLKIQSLSYEDLDRLGTSTMLTRMTSDILQAQSGVNLTLRLISRSPFVVFGAAIMAFFVNVKVAWILVAMILVLSVSVFFIMRSTIRLHKKVQGGLDDVVLTARDNLIGVRVLRAFGKEESQVFEFDEKNKTLTHLALTAGRISAIMNPLTYLIVNIGLIALIRSGAIQVNLGIISQGALVALINYLSQILVELVKLANLIITITRALACWSRVDHVLSLEPAQSYKPSANNIQPDTTPSTVSFENVSFRYPGASEDVLTGVSFYCGAGNVVGIVGSTGSGKSTLVNLIPRFYDVTNGRVAVDGIDVRDYPCRTLLNKISVVAQDVTLFEGTIAENVRTGKPDATDEEVIDALKIAQAWTFVSDLPGTIHAHVAQRGRNLSGGQRQRLTIARALVRKPGILILDDSASALDYQTDANLRHALSALENKPTTFIVSQRTASVMNADLILVMEDGQIVGMGRHDRLMINCPVYMEIYRAQFSEEAEVS